MIQVPSPALREHDPFLLAIHETPEDNAPRLIYADWLEETGDPVWTARAEFIRVQTELTRPSPRNKSKRRRAFLQGRQQELLTAHQGAWLGPWAKVPFRWVFRRGMPERLVGVAQGMLGESFGGVRRVEFQDDGRLRVPSLSYERYWDDDAYWGNQVEFGSYWLQFTFAEVGIVVVLWDMGETDLTLAGRFVRAGGQVRIDLEERRARKPDGLRCSLTFLPPGRETE
jgi:uncharacterized protein (TIGR02996 family)